MIKRFFTGLVEAVKVAFSVFFSRASKHTASMMQVTACFIVCGLAKQENQCNRTVIEVLF
jgi:hypothetical protein